MPTPPTIRLATRDDAETVARLMFELGYECDVDRMRRRLERLAAAPEHMVWVAVDDGEVIACAHAQLSLALTDAPAVDLEALIVARTARKLGVGRALVGTVEQWAASRGVYRVVVRSQTHRAEAREFYLKLGYTPVKEQAVLAREPREHRPDGPTTLVD